MVSALLTFKLGWQAPHRFPFVYAHADAESVTEAHQDPTDWVAPDMISADAPWEDLTDGIYDVLLYDVPAKLFIWFNEQDVIIDGLAPAGEIFNTMARRLPRGLLVLPTDERSMVYAQRKFDERAQSL